ncbi:MAG TPA: RluA family pseudouridine synthase [Marinilabiliaceae bacterium]|nr:RluA family pseudouridine synthase [Marinilabiliaceae bacterium]
MSSEIILKHIVPQVEFNNIRFCDYCGGVFDGLPTKSSVKKAISRGELFINGKPASDGRFVVSGQLIEWRREVKVPERVFELEVPVVYEDDYLAVVNKPAGVVVSGNRFQTLENALVEILQPSSQPDALTMPHAIHRLDSDTSGLVIIGKTASAHLQLSRMMAERKIQKFYSAVVIGAPPKNGTINDPIDQKPAVTHFQTIKKYDSLVSGVLSLLQVKLETGRTHQIRKHLSAAGHPILGDKLYGQPGFVLRHRGLFLCASQLVFDHPVTNKPIDLSIELPAKFTKFPEGEQTRFNKYRNL